jgi:NTP pyrophosphatase (non-canonical NTP hydrolase)
MDIEALQTQLRDFAFERNWQKYHSPKNLSMALAVESSELLEIFQWLTIEESEDKNDISFRKKEVQNELADILSYLLRLADVLEIDLETAIQQKIAKNAIKYPADEEKTPVSMRNSKESSDLDLTTLSKAEQENYIKKNFS